MGNITGRSFASLKFSLAAGNGPFLNTNYGASPSWERPFIPGWVGSLFVYASNLWTWKCKINMRILKEQIFSLHELFSMYSTAILVIFFEEVRNIIDYLMFSVRGAEQCSTKRQNPRVIWCKISKTSERERCNVDLSPTTVSQIDNSLTHPLYCRLLDDASPCEP
jgi:hypothetical protein